MAEVKTPNGLIVGLIPKKPTSVEEKPVLKIEPVKPAVTETSRRGRKKST